MNPDQMTTDGIESEMRRLGYSDFPDLDDTEAERLGELLIEWSTR